MSNSYITIGAEAIVRGLSQGLTREETENVILAAANEKASRRDRNATGRVRALNDRDRRKAEAFNFDAAGVPAELGGFDYGEVGVDVEFGVDQADWQMSAADDKVIEARDRRRAQQAADDLIFDQRVRSSSVKERNSAMAELEQNRRREANVDGRTDWRMQYGPRTVQGDAQIPFLNPIQINDGRLIDDPFLKGKRGPDHNLLAEPERQVRFMGRVDRDRKGNFKELRYPQRDAQQEPRGAAVGNQQALIDAQVRLVGAVRRGEVSAQEAGALIEKLNIDLNPRGGKGIKVKNPGIENERREARAVIAQDAAQFDPVIKELNDRDAARQAQELGNRFNPVNDMNNIPDLKDIGNIKAKMPAKAGGFNEGQYFPDAIQDGVAPAFNASGVPLGLEPPALSNAPTIDNNLNAPRDAREWLVQNQPGYRDGGRIFGDFPQVDIMGAGNDFLSRIQRVKANGESFDPGISAIRNVNDLDEVVRNFGAFAEQGGIKMFQLDENNNEVFRDNVGLPEIFQKLKMNENAQGRLANAMYQLEIGRANGVNVARRAAFELGDDAFGPGKRFNDLKGLEPAGQVQFGARQPAFGNDEAQLQNIPRGAIQVGVDAVGKPIKQELMAALQGLRGNGNSPPLDANELRDARNGLVGLVQGEGRGRNYGFAKPIPEDVDPLAFYKALAVERAKPGKIPDFGKVRANVDRRQGIIDRKEAGDKAVAAKRRQLAIDKIAGGGGPDRPVARGLQRNMDPSTDVGGAGIGGGDRPTAVAAMPSPDPWQTPPATGGGFTGPTQGPRTPGIRQKIMNSIKRAPTNFVAAPRRQRVGAVAGGAILGAMGIDGLIGEERNKREEEQYQ